MYSAQRGPDANKIATAANAPTLFFNMLCLLTSGAPSYQDDQGRIVTTLWRSGDSPALTRIFHQSASFRTQVIEFDDDTGPLRKLRFAMSGRTRVVDGSVQRSLLNEECGRVQAGVGGPAHAAPAQCRGEARLARTRPPQGCGTAQHTVAGTNGGLATPSMRGVELPEPGRARSLPS